jgi:hypothetical protein
MMESYNEEQVRAAVGEMVAANGLRAWCRQHDISPSMVSDYLRSDKPCPPVVASAVGLVREVRYVPKAWVEATECAP